MVGPPMRMEWSVTDDSSLGASAGLASADFASGDLDSLAGSCARTRGDTQNIRSAKAASLSILFILFSSLFSGAIRFRRINLRKDSTPEAKEPRERSRTEDG